MKGGENQAWLALDRAPKIAVLTGAGISAESGIRTFRGADGLWEGHRIEEVATPWAWTNDRKTVWRFYQARRRQLLDVEPNDAHRSLALLEEALPEESFTLITQNVDDLHRRAGSTALIHMHGELRLLRCEGCGTVAERMAESDLIEDEFVPCTECGHASMRPHIVWFHEVPLGMDGIEEAVISADVFLAIGTSGHVYPAAGLVALARSAGSHCIGVNLDEPENIEMFDEFHLGEAGSILLPLIEEWIEAIDG